MVWHHFILIIRIRLHPYEVINVVEAGADDAVVISHIGELRTCDFGHKGAGFRGVVGLVGWVG